MEEILKSIKEAEQKAAEIKAEAQDGCAVIAADAEKKHSYAVSFTNTTATTSDGLPLTMQIIFTISRK